MTTRPARLRPTLNVKMDLESNGPEIKRRRLGNINGGNPNINSGAIKRSTTGPRTRGMMESSSGFDGDDCSNGPSEKMSVQSESNTSGGERERTADKPESSSDSSSSDSSDSSDTEDSSDLDADDCDKRSVENHSDMAELEKQFTYLREYLYSERIVYIGRKLDEVRAGTAIEFLSQLEQLQENMKTRVEVASCLKEYRSANCEHTYQSEALGAHQNLESDKSLLKDVIKRNLEDKIHRLEQDRNNDFTSELWLDKVMKRKNKKSVDIFGEKKKKPVLVSGPYIVYMLQDVDIVEDWTIIKKAASAPKRKQFSVESVLVY